MWTLDELFSISCKDLTPTDFMWRGCEGGEGTGLYALVQVQVSAMTVEEWHHQFYWFIQSCVFLCLSWDWNRGFLGFANGSHVANAANTTGKGCEGGGLKSFCCCCCLKPFLQLSRWYGTPDLWKTRVMRGSNLLFFHNNRLIISWCPDNKAHFVNIM